MFKKIFLFMSLVFLSTTVFAVRQYDNLLGTITQAQASMVLAGYGDLLGRVTEFKSTFDDIFAKYPNGVTGIDSLTADDWQRIPKAVTGKDGKIAPFTDDTAMAILVADAFIHPKGNDGYNTSTFQRIKNWIWSFWSEPKKEENLAEKPDLDTVMSTIAHNFINDMGFSNGWAAPFRAPGVSTLKSVNHAKTVDQNNPEWWDQSEFTKDFGGCGSVMRVHPCGIRFYDDPQKAEEYAVAQSKITQSHPWALAACAAMAVGTAYALQGTDEKEIIEHMKKAADRYDDGSAINMMTGKPNSRKTSQKIDFAYQNALKMRELWVKNNIKTSQDLIDQLKNSNSEIRKLHQTMCTEFPGWTADDAIAATVYCTFSTHSSDPRLPIILGVHTTGDSDSIASMTGALIGARRGFGPDPELEIKAKKGWSGPYIPTFSVMSMDELKRIEQVDLLLNLGKELMLLNPLMREHAYLRDILKL